MIHFLDTEFSERGPTHPIELISIGLKAVDGRKFYAVSTEFDAEACNDWVKANVLGPNLWERNPLIGTRKEIAQAVREFVGFQTVPPTFWTYYGDYDWVVFCQLFGTMMDLPAGWPMYARDLKQLCDELGNPRLPPQKSTEHHALNDAEWNETAYEFLFPQALKRGIS